MSEVQDVAFIHVVGRVNLAEKSGKIDYVTPAIDGQQLQSDAVDDHIRLEIWDKDKNVLDSIGAVLRRPSCDGGVAQYGLIQENLPRIEGMTDVVLKVEDKVVDRFSPHVPGFAAALTSALAPIATTLAGVVGLGGIFPPTGRRKRGYTIQVQQEDKGKWQTIAVDSASPEVAVDPRQFPGAKRLQIRVLESDGFGWSEISNRAIEIEGQENATTVAAPGDEEQGAAL